MRRFAGVGAERGARVEGCVLDALEAFAPDEIGDVGGVATLSLAPTFRQMQDFAEPMRQRVQARRESARVGRGVGEHAQQGLVAFRERPGGVEFSSPVLGEVIAQRSVGAALAAATLPPSSPIVSRLRRDPLPPKTGEEKHRKLTRHASGLSSSKPTTLRARVRVGQRRGGVLGFGSAAASMMSRRRISASPARNQESRSG